MINYKYAAFDRDYHEVCQSLRTLRPQDLTALGITLGLSYPTILRMGSGDDFLNQIVAAWLKRQDDVLKYSGEPTWRVLEDKLEKLGHTEIATSIRRRAQHGGEREQQQDGISPVAPSTDSLTDDQQQPTSLSGQLCDPHQTSAPISSQSMTLSKQECDQPCVR